MHDIWKVAAIALATAATRFLPFLIFGGKRRAPEAITRLGNALPCAIMGMLVVYCLKDISFLQAPYGIPELLGCVIVAALHIWKRNTLLSIGGGTVCYMLLLHFLPC